MPDVKMNYDMMEDMSRAFSDGANQMEEVAKSMQNVAKLLEDGALLGLAGDKLLDVLRNKHIPKCLGLKSKLEELSGDILGALTDERDGDKEAASRFKS